MHLMFSERRWYGKATTLAFREAQSAELAERSKSSAIIEQVSGMKTLFTRHDLYRAVTDDPASFAAIKAQLDVHPSIVTVELPGSVRGRAPELLTTVEAIETERSVTALGDAMSEARDFGLTSASVSTAFESLSFDLSDEQQAAVRHVTGDERLSLCMKELRRR